MGWLTALLCATWPAFGDGALAQDAARPEAPRATLAADATEAEFHALVAELEKAAAGRSRAAREELTATFLPRFRELAEKGSERAMVWCLRRSLIDPVPPARRAERRQEYEPLLDRFASRRSLLEEGLFLVLEDEAERGLGRAAAVDLCLAFEARTRDPEVRAAAMLTRARLLPRETSRAVYDELLRRHPDSPFAGEARDDLWRREHLIPGKTAPDFDASDAAGNEIRLSDYRGRVVVLYFWSYADEIERDSLELYRRLADVYSDHDFALIGVVSDSDRETFAKRCDAEEIRWTNAWEGADGRPATEAWRVRRRPMTYVIDARGVLRAVNPGDLFGVVADLLPPR